MIDYEEYCEKESTAPKEKEAETRKQTLEEVLKWLPNNVKLEDLNSDANVEGITFRLKKWLEQELKRLSE